jgi:NAD+ diphosphatase
MDISSCSSPLECLDRAAHRRTDTDWVEAQIKLGARFAFVWRGCNLFRAGVTPAPLWLESPNFPGHLIPSFLGVLPGGLALFAVDLGEFELSTESASFTQIREFKGSLDPDERGLLFYARSLVFWQNEQRYCNRCGSPTTFREAGHMMLCTNAECAAIHFPRTDPAVIVLIHHGDRCLLGRQPVWPEGIYSTLAGFVETGESLENAVVREVREESAIELKDVRYFGSQPWPFPQSLMLGFMAEAATIEITCGSELADVRWFGLTEARAVLARLEKRTAHLDTIARRLIRAWVNSKN